MKRKTDKKPKVKDVVVTENNGRYSMQLLINKKGLTDPKLVTSNAELIVQRYYQECEKHSIRPTSKLIYSLINQSKQNDSKSKR